MGVSSLVWAFTEDDERVGAESTADLARAAARRERMKSGCIGLTDFIAHACGRDHGWHTMNAQEISMAHMFRLFLGCALALATGQAWSQQVRQPEPWGVQPAPRPMQPQVERPQVIPANPGQRPQSTSPVQSEGPAKLLPVQPPQVRTVPDPEHLPTRVFDASGRPLSGMLRVAPNRALDPATGRYYRTTSAGKILGPPPADM
jgi:hypothetical protein